MFPQHSPFHRSRHVAVEGKHVISRGWLFDSGLFNESEQIFLCVRSEQVLLSYLCSLS